jgi:hypothetical protein
MQNGISEFHENHEALIIYSRKPADASCAHNGIYPVGPADRIG